VLGVTTTPTHPVDVLLILTHQDRVLLALRQGTGYADGQWNLPSGKLEPGEDALSAIIRETHEEIGVRLDPAQVAMVATVHHRNTAGQARVGLVFTAAHDPASTGEAVNTEPHKCARVDWFDPESLPHSTYPYTVASVHAWQRGVPLRLSGWPTPQPGAAYLRRERPGRSRPARCYDFAIGSLSGTLTVTELPDGRPGEIFVQVAKPGSILAGLCESLSVTTSLALQHGTPVVDLVRRMVNTRFEPSGATDDPDVPVATSLSDYIARRLATDYLDAGQLAALHLTSPVARPLAGVTG
jgi:8-oxo-dGTP diphosphatase